MADPLRTRILYPRVARRPLLAYLSVDLAATGRQVRLILTAPSGGLRAEEAESIYGELRQQLATQLDRVERGIGRG